MGGDEMKKVKRRKIKRHSRFAEFILGLYNNGELYIWLHFTVNNQVELLRLGPMNIVFCGPAKELWDRASPRRNGGRSLQPTKENITAVQTMYDHAMNVSNPSVTLDLTPPM
jgi:hypothetical protein